MQITKNILIIIVGLVLVSLVYNFSAIKREARVSEPQISANSETPNEPSGNTNIEENEPAVITVRIDQGASAQGVKIVPTAVLEDSRCPMNARCIWAGRLRIQAIVMVADTLKTEEFVLGESKVVFGKTIALISVRPETEASIQIPTSQYEFDFEVR